MRYIMAVNIGKAGALFVMVLGTLYSFLNLSTTYKAIIVCVSINTVVFLLFRITIILSCFCWVFFFLHYQLRTKFFEDNYSPCTYLGY